MREPRTSRPPLRRKPPSQPLGQRLLSLAGAVIAALLVVAALLYAFNRFVIIPARQTSSDLGARPEASTGTDFRSLAVRLLLSTKQAQLRPVSDDPDAPTVAFEIMPGETASDVASNLAAESLIRDHEAFVLLLRKYGLDTRIEAGHYELSPAMSAEEIAHALLESRGEDIVLVVLEGWRWEQTATAVGVATGDETGFASLVTQSPATSAPAWVQIPADTTSLEGMLFPDTYRLPREADAATALDTLLVTFEQRFDQERRERAAEVGLTPYQVLILASIVEREAVIAEERPLIAGVFLNRMDLGIKLEADPTTQYAIGQEREGGPWWKVPLLLTDLTYDSPYNTYVYTGLPPSPICSPGLSSIDAVLWPEESEFLYFVAKDDSSHVFSRTFDEHLANVAHYRSQ